MKDLIEKKLGDGELKNAISIFLKWEIINNETRSELLLSSSRYNSAYRNYLNGLMREEDFRIESNKITLATLELLHEIERRYIGSPLKTISPSILVAGTGTNGITEKEIFASKILGNYLGINNYILITGGWEGVDFYTAVEFSKAVEESNEKNLFKRLFQIIPKYKNPMFESGNVFYVNEGIDEWTKSLNLADYVILIGGIGGTYSTYKLAIKENIPVFPFFDTKGDTTRVYKELYENWPSEVYKNIPKEEFFNLLSKEINSKEDVIEILNSIKYFIDKIKN